MHFFENILTRGIFSQHVYEFNTWLYNTETRGVFIAGLCCVGAWVLLSWMLQLIRSLLWILWPLVLLASLYLILPEDTRSTLVNVVIPNQVRAIRDFFCGQKQYNMSNYHYQHNYNY